MKGGYSMKLSSYEKWLLETGLNKLKHEAEDDLKRMEQTYYGIENGQQVIDEKKKYLSEIEQLKIKFKLDGHK
jgi:aspartate/glutamate racemase